MSSLWRFLEPTRNTWYILAAFIMFHLPYPILPVGCSDLTRTRRRLNPKSLISVSKWSFLQYPPIKWLIYDIWNDFWLVLLIILKNMTSSMGRMTSHIWKINEQKMFETTSQDFILHMTILVGLAPKLTHSYRLPTHWVAMLVTKGSKELSSCISWG